MKRLFAFLTLMKHQILKMFWTTTTLAFVSLICTSALLTGLPKVSSAEQPSFLNDKNNSNPKEIVESSGSNEGISKSAESNMKNQYPDLGSDQVFPFVAGLDSYE